MRKLLIVILTAASLVGVGSAPAQAARFNDVPSSHTFVGEIFWLSSSGITTGYGDGTFRPGQSVLREQMAVFLWRQAGSPRVSNLPKVSPFRDVSRSHAFYEAIVWLSRTGISTGYADGTFRPSQPVLREQMAAFLYRFRSLSAKPGTGTSSFRDVSSRHTFATQISWLASTTITTGYADGTFRPGAAVLREQMAAFLFRYHVRFAPGTEATTTNQLILNETNAYRALHGKPALRFHPGLTRVAQNWSTFMGTRCDYRHNPSYSTQIPGGWRAAAENIAAGQQPSTIVAAWIASPSHRANLLGDFTHIGIGSLSGSKCQYPTYFVQVFARYP